MKKSLLGAVAAASLVLPQIAVAADGPSRYLRCDGQPNNVTGMEDFARFLGAITLLGLFAPAKESPNPSAREFGEAGVAVCTDLLDSADREDNQLRRIPLFLARAAHRIEIADYDGAIEDVGLARAQAAEAQLVGNPYFERSMGLHFDRLESVALLRRGQPEEAQRVALRGTVDRPFSIMPLVAVDTFSEYLPEMSEEEEQYRLRLARVWPGGLNAYASRLEEVGRYADAAKARDDWRAVIEAMQPTKRSAQMYAHSAVSHALAGNFETAQALADEADQILRINRNNGDTEGQTETVEVLDLFEVLRLASTGEEAKARRSFASRSRWLSPSFGAVMAANALLREGAESDDMFGALELTPEAMWEQRRDDTRAADLARDKDNASLFSGISGYAETRKFNRASGDVWRQKKSKMMSEKPSGKSGLYTIYSDDDVLVRPDAILLHAAIEAKKQKQPGFQFMLIPSGPVGFVRFGKPGDEGIPESLFVDADRVIAELGQIIPDPDSKKRRRR
ncbi:hypothetical protein GCM10010923_01960 [Blastomonas marina]|uniref:Uncharacterized protein n=1 Tax=Blastomonas marina TaxID=1867408 RepID=A0ABQ1F223_9SPHN|nr:hypothetical protein [Blastomonas marina]GFZ97528.1 hypothetical protein GCM10010923_01960 [Blastomonas marina]